MNAHPVLQVRMIRRLLCAKTYKRLLTRLDAMDLLLSHGADINAVTNWEATPLHMAAFHGNAKAATLLIERGARLDGKDGHGQTPLGVAEARGHVECAECLRHWPDAAAQATEPAQGFDTLDSGERIAEAPAGPAGVDAGMNWESQVSAMDAFYDSFGRSDNIDPHPMDEICLAYLFKGRKSPG